MLHSEWFITNLAVKLFRGACGSKSCGMWQYRGDPVSSSFAELVDLNNFGNSLVGGAVGSSSFAELVDLNPLIITEE